MVPLGASYQEETLSGTMRCFLSISGELGGHQSWGNPGPGAGETARPALGKRWAAQYEGIPYRESKNPFRQAWLGNYICAWNG